MYPEFKLQHDFQSYFEKKRWDGTDVCYLQLLISIYVYNLLHYNNISLRTIKMKARRGYHTSNRCR
jgi:hypothetical protein